MISAKDSFVIFLHIQKTGGITIQRIFRRKLGKSISQRLFNLIKNQDNFATLEELFKSKRNQDRYIIGHFCYGIDRYLPQPSTYMAFLREPVSRVISLYYYSKNNPTAYYHQHAINKTLAEFVLAAPLMELDNGQVRFLAGDKKDFFINRTPIGKCDDHLLEKAKANIEKYFSFIGITEYFDQSILLLQHIMEWKNCYYLRRNVSKKIDKEIISQELKEKIREKNYLDIKLYEYAKELFLKKLKQYNLDDKNKLQKFQKYNFIFNQLLSVPYSIYDQAKTTIRGTGRRPG